MWREGKGNPSQKETWWNNMLSCVFSVAAGVNRWMWSAGHMMIKNVWHSKDEKYFSVVYICIYPRCVLKTVHKRGHLSTRVRRGQIWFSSQNISKTESTPSPSFPSLLLYVSSHHIWQNIHLCVSRGLFLLREFNRNGLVRPETSRRVLCV